MSRRALDHDLAAVRRLLVVGRQRAGDLDDYWLNSARRRLESIDELLVRAAGGLGGWTRTSIGATAMLAGALGGGAGARAAGLPTFGVVVSAWVVAVVVEVPVRRWAARWSVVIARRRLDRWEGPGEAIPPGGLADLPELLSRARVRLVSAALRRAGSRQWRVPSLTRVMAVEPAIFFLSRADELLCQAIDHLEEHLAADRKEPT